MAGVRARVKKANAREFKATLDPERIFSRGSVRDLALNVHEFIQESSYT